MSTNSYAESAAAVTFADFALSEPLQRAVADAGFVTPSPIQLMAIPAALAGRDLIGQAETGSGKTAAFVLPILETLKGKGIGALILVPTRELAQQVVVDIEKLGKHKNTKVVGVVGGQSSFRQIELINRGAEVVVATPGRLLDLLESGRIKRFAPTKVVLDEADEMLDMGFIEDIRSILAFIPKERQTMLFSATLPKPLMRLVHEQLRDPEHIKLTVEDEAHKDIEQLVYVVKPDERQGALVRLIDAEAPQKAVVFCRTRRDASDLCDLLTAHGVGCRALHGDLSQDERSRAIRDVKQGTSKVLVATDVASRGLHIPDLSHVINFHVPENHERYTHRIGRTGRAGKRGKALTIATPAEVRMQRYLQPGATTKIRFKPIPTRNDVERRNAIAFFNKIHALEINDEAREDCEKFIAENGEKEFLFKLYSMLRSKQRVAGPDTLGFTPDQAAGLLQKPRFNDDRRPRRGDRRKFRSRRPSQSRNR